MYLQTQRSDGNVLRGFTVQTWPEVVDLFHKQLSRVCKAVQLHGVWLHFNGIADVASIVGDEANGAVQRGSNQIGGLLEEGVNIQGKLRKEMGQKRVMECIKHLSAVLLLNQQHARWQLVALLL